MGIGRQAEVEKLRWPEIQFRASQGAQLGRLGSNDQMKPKCKSERSIWKDYKRLNERMKIGKHGVSQSGTKTTFMMPQIVNPGSNFLLLLHSTSLVNNSHLPMLKKGPTKPRL